MSERILIDRDEAIVLLRAVVEEQGIEFRYVPVDDDSGEAVCRYVVDGYPSCLVGKALHRAGVLVEELDRMDGTSNTGIMVAASRLPADVVVTSDARKVFEAAQEVQDDLKTWGAALTAAEERLAAWGEA